jgi:predicted enzyme related to lactoylglutathione lyase
MSEMHSSPDRVVWFDLPVAGNFTFAVLEHGRIRDALRQTEKHGGRVVKAIESIGPHGFRAIVLDSEGNRIALHSGSDK